MIKSVRFLREDVALAHVQWHLIFQQGENTAINTLVLTKEDGSWRIAAFQNTPLVQGAA